MRKTCNINQDWRFVRQAADAEQAVTAFGIPVDLPHTWNGEDGQDGGGDYHRGVCYYVKELPTPEMDLEDEVWLEFRGVNSSADVYLNGTHLGHHDGGYATFRVEATSALQKQNILVVAADNEPNGAVYPQQADFTFYGGIYRDVHLLVVNKHHFDLTYHGASGLAVTPKMEGADAIVTLEARTCGGDDVRFTIEGVGVVTAEVQKNLATATLTIPKVHLWHGISDPFLYNAKAEMLVNGQVTDNVETAFGCRSFYVDGDKGFFLNGQSYPLRGVCRHQDRKGVGNALTHVMMEEDMALLIELGANTVRLAHYQHDQYFYDLCDRAGLVVWAEIPYISLHMPSGRENSLSQMRELILQSYNHPSIVCWGLSNETSIMGVTEDLMENHNLLNDLAHSLDGTRFTVMANISSLDVKSELNSVSDQLSFNLYYGWYSGELSEMDEWFDKFRTAHPSKAIGVSEYGADAAIHLQTGAPKRGDYTEQYQALVHEHMAQLLAERPYIWASHVWSMFDFGSDRRNEGDVEGVNLKGLITMDRKIKKDAFFLYKAYWSAVPFVHICGRRYIDRHEEVTTIKVYSNQPMVTLFCDGVLVAEQESNKVFTFKLPITGDHTVTVKAGDWMDSINIRKVAELKPEYMLVKTGITNWFEREEMKYLKGYFSVKDSLSDIMDVPEAAAAVQGLQEKLAVARSNMKLPPGITAEQMGSRAAQLSFKAILKNLGDALDPEELLAVNNILNQIKKPE